MSTAEPSAWKEMIIVGVSVVLVVSSLGYFITSCETSKHRMITDCLRLGRNAAECKLMEKP